VDDPNVQLHKYFPHGHKKDILITTRHQDVVRLTQEENSDNIAELDPQEAYQLLLKSARLEDKLDHVEDAAAKVLLRVRRVSSPWLHCPYEPIQPASL
jgi:hypothetical protein